MNDPLLTDRAPGALGRAIVGIPALLARLVLVLLMFIPMAIINYRWDIRACFEGAVEYVIWGEDGPPRPPQPPVLSARAKALWERIQNSANWYPAYSDRTPKAMQELVDAGLVVIGGRVESLKAAYVPAGTQPFKLERFPNE